MTKTQFKKWIEQHPADLLRVAWTLRAVRSRKVEAQDAVQAGLERALRTKNYLRCRTKPLSWFMHSVKSAVSNGLTSRKRARIAHRELLVTLTAGTFRKGVAVTDDGDYQGGMTLMRPMKTDPEGLFPSPEERLITPEEREAERAEWQAEREAEALRRDDQDATRQWDKRLPRVTWFYPDGRVAATSDPLETTGNLRSPFRR